MANIISLFMQNYINKYCILKAALVIKTFYRIHRTQKLMKLLACIFNLKSNFRIVHKITT